MIDRLRQAGRLVAFTGWYAWTWLRSNATVMAEVLTPGTGIAPGFLELPLRCRTDLEVTTIANLITLTPGTVTVATRHDADGSTTIWVHGLYAHDTEALRSELWDMEGRMLAAMRPEPDPGPPPRERLQRRGGR